MIKIIVENKEIIPKEGVYNNIDLSQEEDDEVNKVISNENISYSNIDKVLKENEKVNESNKTEVNEPKKLNEIELNKTEEINPFEKIGCKPCGICYFFSNEIFPENLDLLKEINNQIKNKNKMIKFICRKYYDKKIKVYTNYYLNEIVYNFKNKIYIFIFQSFKLFVESFDVIYYYRECKNSNK